MYTKKTTKKKPAAKKTITKRKPAKKPAAPWKPKTRALMLRTCSAQMTGHGGFKWPRSGYVEAPDWNPAAVCGGGLHGLLWGEGDAGYLSVAEGAVWMVVEVDAGEVVSIDGDKVKVPRGNVVFAGQRHEATAFLMADPGAAGKRCNYGTATAGDGGTISIQYYDPKRDKYRVMVAEVGEGGIKPNTAYHVVDGKLTEKPKT